jgi:hypothetical protein
VILYAVPGVTSAVGFGTLLDLSKSLSVYATHARTASRRLANLDGEVRERNRASLAR